MIKLTIPGEPCAQGRPKFTKTGVAYDPEKSRNYKAFVKMIASEMRPIELSTRDLEVTITAYFSIPKSAAKKYRDMYLDGRIKPSKKPDIDNIAKIICDSCNGIIYADDKQITDLIIKKRYDAVPRVEVEIKAVG